MNTWKIIGWSIVAIAAVIGISIGGDYLNTAQKAATAPAHVANKFIDRSVDTSVYSYEKFRDMYNAFLAQKGKIAIAKQHAKDDQYSEIDLEGMQQSCLNIVAEYNADSEKTTKSIFKMGGQLLTTTLDAEECN